MLSIPTLIVISLLFLVLLFVQFLWMRSLERELLVLREFIFDAEGHVSQMFGMQMEINLETSKMIATLANNAHMPRQMQKPITGCVSSVNGVIKVE